jgi:hypothetical protein
VDAFADSGAPSKRQSVVSAVSAVSSGSLTSLADQGSPGGDLDKGSRTSLMESIVPPSIPFDTPQQSGPAAFSKTDGWERSLLPSERAKGPAANRVARPYKSSTGSNFRSPCTLNPLLAWRAKALVVTENGIMPTFRIRGGR